MNGSPPADPAMPLLRVEGLTTQILTLAGPRRILEGVAFTIARAEVLAIVGESGSGKSMAMQGILGLLPQPALVTGGSALFEGRDLLRLPADEMRSLRGDRIGTIFQEPMSALNPMLAVGNQIAETLVMHRGLGWGLARRESVRLLDRVKVADAARVARLRPHELSGGMRQRVVIAAAIACKPSLLIADEPTTALDASVQAEIIALLGELRREVGCAIILITHDMSLAGEIADRTCVMLNGAIVESGPTAALMQAPRSAYARTLVKASLPAMTSAERKPSSDMRPVLEVRDVTVAFPLRRSLFAVGAARQHVAVADVSFSLAHGETLALVGESGSGKTTLARAILGLAPMTKGTIRIEGEPLSSSFKSDRASGEHRKRARPPIQLVFQDPQASLNPLFKCWRCVAEPAYLQGTRRRSELRARAAALLSRVGLGPDYMDRLPHELSGGQRQRVGIARALMTEPKILIADEAVAALDATTRLQILELFQILQAESGISYLFITHDFAVVARIAHRVAVMRHGRIVEIGPAAAILQDPRHAYTRSLLAAAPAIHIKADAAAASNLRDACSIGLRSVGVFTKVGPEHYVIDI
jgi:peptide/nickel transport system ATP-binding protein